MKTTAKTCHVRGDNEDLQSVSYDKKPAGWWRRLYEYYRQRRLLQRSRKLLMSLDDMQLRDIGLTRHDLPYRDERK